MHGIMIGLDSGIKKIDIEGGIQDFVYLEGKNSIVYRNDDNQLYETPLQGNKTAPILNGHMEMPLSHLLDSSGRYLLSDGNTFLFDMQEDAWTHFTGPTGPIEHLFWWTWKPIFKPARTVLYSMSSEARLDDTLSYRLYEYSPANDLTRSCTIDVPSDYRLVKGSTKPYLIFYRETPDPRGREISFRRFVFSGHGGSCIEKPFFIQARQSVIVRVPLSVPLEDVYRFGDMSSTVFKFNHPKANLVWLNETADLSKDPCQVYNIDNSRPIFLNDSQPVVATRSANGKLDLFFLSRQTTDYYKAELPLKYSDTRYMWLTNDGGKFFFSPEVSCGEKRQLVQIDLQSPGH